MVGPMCNSALEKKHRAWTRYKRVPQLETGNSIYSGVTFERTLKRIIQQREKEQKRLKQGQVGRKLCWITVIEQQRNTRHVTIPPLETQDRIKH